MHKVKIELDFGPYDKYLPRRQVDETRKAIKHLRESYDPTLMGIQSISVFVWQTLNNERKRGGFEFAESRWLDKETGLLNLDWAENVSDELNLEFEQLLKSNVLRGMNHES